MTKIWLKCQKMANSINWATYNFFVKTLNFNQNQKHVILKKNMKIKMLLQCVKIAILTNI